MHNRDQFERCENGLNSLGQEQNNADFYKGEESSFGSSEEAISRSWKHI